MRQKRPRRLKPIAFRYWWDTMPEKGDDWILREEFNSLSDRSLTEHLTTIRCRGELADGEIAVISVLRNEASRLPLFFEHYKKLGVTRFFMVDNNSDDGSHEILLAEPMADVFHTATPYKQGQMGIYWYNGLARAYCRGHWTVTADADELLVYDEMDKHSLHDLAQWLDSNDFDRLFALMVDVYTSGRVGRGKRSVAKILATDCWFDEFGYHIERKPAGLLVTGGVRDRLFNQGPEIHDHWLSKYPFFRMNPGTVIFDAHFLWPYNEDPPGPMSALVHLKLMDDFVERSKRAEAELQHVNNSNVYRIINERLAENPAMTAYNEESCRFDGPQSLLDHRIMRPIDWSQLAKPKPHRVTEPVLYWSDTMPAAGAFWSRKQQFNDICRQALATQLETVRASGPLADGDMPVICVLRNEAERLPIFLEHYKSLGATRFIMVDNGSTDGTRDILLAEPLADIYYATVSYRDGCCGIFWQNGLAREHCTGHWVTVVDADELLVFDGMEKKRLDHLARLLEAQGRDRLLAMLLDVYPSGVIGRGGRSIAEILLNDCFFDDEGYRVTREDSGWVIRGGARARLFEQTTNAASTRLSKFPFFRMDGETAICNANHLWPYDSQGYSSQGVLLHLKLMDDLIARTKTGIAENQHWSDSIHYRQIQETIEQTPNIVAIHPNSRRYRGPKSLIRSRLMAPIAWG